MSWPTGWKTEAAFHFYPHAVCVVPLAGKLFKLCTIVNKPTLEEKS